jgi:hypothetical protein
VQDYSQVGFLVVEPSKYADEIGTGQFNEYLPQLSVHLFNLQCNGINRSHHFRHVQFPYAKINEVVLDEVEKVSQAFAVLNDVLNHGLLLGFIFVDDVFEVPFDLGVDWEGEYVIRVLAEFEVHEWQFVDRLDLGGCNYF